MLIGTEKKFPPFSLTLRNYCSFFFFQLKKYCQNKALELELWEVPTWGGVVGTETSPTPLLPIPPLGNQFTMGSIPSKERK